MASFDNLIMYCCCPRQVALIKMIDGPDDIRRDWLAGAETVGLTAGASAPEVLVQRVVDRLREWGATVIDEQNGVPETVTFPVPKELRS